jgi:hypothetical protein
MTGINLLATRSHRGGHEAPDPLELVGSPRDRATHLPAADRSSGCAPDTAAGELRAKWEQQPAPGFGQMW